MRFADFLRDPFLKCQRFVNLAVHFIRARNSLILLISTVSVFVESSNDRLFASLFQMISHWINLLHFDNFEHFVLQFGV